MASVNKVILIGNLGKDPETRYSADGAAITNCSIATTETWKGNDGEKKEHTEWHRLVFFNRLGEIAGEYLRKGKPIYVEGRLRTRKWTDKDGVERYSTEVVVDNLQMLGSKDDGQRQSSAPARASQEAARQNRPQPSGGIADMDDDIPF